MHVKKLKKKNKDNHNSSFSVKLDDVASSPDDTVHHSCMQQLSCLVLSKRISGTAGRVLYTTVEQSSSSSIHIFNTYVMSHLVKYFFRARLVSIGRVARETCNTSPRARTCSVMVSALCDVTTHAPAMACSRTHASFDWKSWLQCGSLQW